MAQTRNGNLFADAYMYQTVKYQTACDSLTVIIPMFMICLVL